jgi:hypothetical protein
MGKKDLTGRKNICGGGSGSYGARITVDGTRVTVRARITVGVSIILRGKDHNGEKIIMGVSIIVIIEKDLIGGKVLVGEG